MDVVGGVDSRGGYVSKILYVQTKESGPFGERGHSPGTPPSRSANAGTYKHFYFGYTANQVRTDSGG